MRLKRDAHGHVVVQDGHPVYVGDDGKEVTFDPVASMKSAKAAKAAADAEVAGWQRAAVGGWFQGSRYIAENLKLPPEMMMARFGKNFQFDGSKPVARDDAGNIIYTRSGPLAPAEFDEALEILVGRYPERDKILKTSGTPGGSGGARSEGEGHPPKGSAPPVSDQKTVTRAQFDAMNVRAKHEHFKSGGTVTD
jgi:hypothetical protein